MESATALQLALAVSGGLASILSAITLTRMSDIGRDIKEISSTLGGHKTEIELLKQRMAFTPHIGK